MSFLNAALLAGGLAFVIPLCIHLLNRTRVRRVDWGAMHLLEAAMKKNNRSFQWKSWLLLLLRCCIPIVLALCLARPVLTHFRATWAQGSQTLLFLVDDSLSMGQIQELSSDGNKTFLSSLTDQCASIATSQPNSEKYLWTTSRLQDVQPLAATQDTQELTAAFDRLRPESGSLDPVASVRRALGKLNEFSASGRHLILASDFRAADWQGISDSDLDSLKAMCETQVGPLRISLLSLPTNSKSSNISVRFTSNSSDRALPDEPVVLKFEVINHGSENAADIPVTLAIDGKTVERQLFSIGAGGSRQLEFGCQFADTGWHYAVCRILVDPTGVNDDLQFDNESSFVFEIANPPQLLLVDPSVGANSSYLAVALAPFSADQAGFNRYRIASVQPSDFVQQMRELKPQSVVLNGVSRLDDEATRELQKFVHGGGSLLVFPSSSLDLDWYHAQSQNSGLLPMQYGAEAETKNEAELKRQFFQHPDLQVFNGREAGDLYELRFSRWLNMSPISQSTEVGLAGGELDTPTSILELSDGTPMLVLHRFGLGSVAQHASAIDERWCNLPQKPVFVPWIQQLLQATLTTRIQANLQTHESPLLRIGGLDSSQRQLDPSLPLTAQISDLSSQEIITTRRLVPIQQMASLMPLHRTGVFRLSVEAPENSVEPPLTVSTIPPLLSITEAATESELRQMNQQELRALSNRLGGSLLKSADDFESILNLHRSGREIWRPLVAALLILVFGEILLARSITRSGSAA